MYNKTDWFSCSRFSMVTADANCGWSQEEGSHPRWMDGRIKSKAAQQAALARMKKEGKKHLVKVFKPTKKGFKLQPKEGTKAYDIEDGEDGVKNLGVL